MEERDSVESTEQQVPFGKGRRSFKEGLNWLRQNYARADKEVEAASVRIGAWARRFGSRVVNMAELVG